MQNRYLKEWRDEHKEDIKWDYMVWVENNTERRREISKRGWDKHKNYYYALRKLKRKLDGVEKK